jgi:hypothetical protein
MMGTNGKQSQLPEGPEHHFCSAPEKAALIWPSGAKEVPSGTDFPTVGKDEIKVVLQGLVWAIGLYILSLERSVEGHESGCHASNLLAASEVNHNILIFEAYPIEVRKLSLEAAFQIVKIFEIPTCSDIQCSIGRLSEKIRLPLSVIHYVKVYAVQIRILPADFKKPKNLFHRLSRTDNRYAS